MRLFFSGWKRKLGVLTLLMACVLMAGWVRSKYVMEALICSIGQIPTHSISSRDGSLIWTLDDNPNFGKYPFYASTAVTGQRWDSPFVKWRWRRLGFAYGETTEQVFRQGNTILSIWNGSILVIPYWSLVVPLTALTAWLLFSKSKRIDKPAVSLSTVSAAAL